MDLKFILFSLLLASMLFYGCLNNTQKTSEKKLEEHKKAGGPENYTNKSNESDELDQTLEDVGDAIEDIEDLENMSDENLSFDVG